MENGVEALKLAASILIFVMAVTITISVFTSAVQALNRIFDMQNGDEYVTDANGNFLNFVDFEVGKGTRKVGIETIVPTMYRAYKENFVIYFFNKDKSKFVLYVNSDGEEVNYINLEKGLYGESSLPVEALGELLYKESSLYSNGLYKELQGKTFVEMLGEYYTNDVRGETSIAEVNKSKRRVIAYIEE